MLFPGEALCGIKIYDPTSRETKFYSSHMPRTSSTISAQSGRC
jgi:hypothetical protein